MRARAGNRSRKEHQPGSGRQRLSSNGSADVSGPAGAIAALRQNLSPAELPSRDRGTSQPTTVLGEHVVNLSDQIGRVTRHRIACQVLNHKDFGHCDEAEDGREAKKPLDVFEGSHCGVEAAYPIERGSAHQQGLHQSKAEAPDPTCF